MQSEYNSNCNMKVAIILSFLCAIATASPNRVCGRYSYRQATFPNRQDCSKYYQCSRGQLISRQCRDGLLYNSRYARCVLPQDSGCKDYQRYINQRNEEYCQTFGDGALFSNVLNCNKFYECANGVPVQLDCPAGLVFNMNNHVCDYPNQTACARLLSLPNTERRGMRDEIVNEEGVADLLEEVGFPDEYGVDNEEKAASEVSN